METSQVAQAALAALVARLDLLLVVLTYDLVNMAFLLIGLGT